MLHSSQYSSVWLGEEGEGEMYGESNMETYIALCKMDSQWEFVVCLGKLCDNLEGFDRKGGRREVQREGTYVYLWLIMLIFGRKQQNSVKQLSFNQKIYFKNSSV